MLNGSLLMHTKKYFNYFITNFLPSLNTSKACIAVIAIIIIIIIIIIINIIIMCLLETCIFPVSLLLQSLSSCNY
jgi:hypothetical protein